MRPSRLSYRARASVLAARERARAYGGDGDTLAVAVAVDSVGDVLLTGRFDGTVDFGNGTHVSAGDYDVFLAKIRIE